MPICSKMGWCAKYIILASTCMGEENEVIKASLTCPINPVIVKRFPAKIVTCQLARWSFYPNGVAALNHKGNVTSFCISQSFFLLPFFLFSLFPFCFFPFVFSFFSSFFAFFFFFLFPFPSLVKRFKRTKEGLKESHRNPDNNITFMVRANEKSSGGRLSAHRWD